MSMLAAVVWSVVILFVVIAAQGLAGITNNGIKWGVGPRDKSKDDTLFQARSKRTVANHIESMMLFVPLALVAHIAGVAGVADDMIGAGACMYVIARALYPLTYWTGLSYVRTVVWLAGVVGTIMVFLPTISAV